MKMFQSKIRTILCTNHFGCDKWLRSRGTFPGKLPSISAMKPAAAPKTFMFFEWVILLESHHLTEYFLSCVIGEMFRTNELLVDSVDLTCQHRSNNFFSKTNEPSKFKGNIMLFRKVKIENCAACHDQSWWLCYTWNDLWISTFAQLNNISFSFLTVNQETNTSRSPGWATRIYFRSPEAKC